VLNVALYWLLVPYRTQQRFMLQALGVGVVPLARLFDRGRAWRGAAALLLAAHLLTHQGWPFTGPGQDPPWDLSPLIPNAIGALIPHGARQLTPSWSRSVGRGQVAGTLVIGLAALAVAWSWGQAARSPTRPRRLGALTLSAGLVGLAVALPLLIGVAPRLFYPPFRDYYVGWLQLEARSGPAGARIAYAGTNIPYYLLGAGLRNEVRYVNVDTHRGWLLHDYHRDARLRGSPTWPNPRPGWDRLHPDYDAWLANLRAERIQMLVVARANPAEGHHNVADSLQFPIERQWAESHPETFEPLYGVFENDPEFRIYRLRPGSSSGSRLPASSGAGLIAG
jgi:hypothetical protein